MTQNIIEKTNAEFDRAKLSKEIEEFFSSEEFLRPTCKKSRDGSFTLELKYDEKGNSSIAKVIHKTDKEHLEYDETGKLICICESNDGGKTWFDELHRIPPV